MAVLDSLFNGHQDNSWMVIKKQFQTKGRKEIIINDSNLKFYFVICSVNNTTRILLQPPCQTIFQIAHNLKIMSK